MARAWKSRYGHVFSSGTRVAFRGEGSWRGPKPPSEDLTAISHPENRTPAKVSPDLIAMHVWEAIETGVRIRLSCDNCHHETVWTRGDLEKTLKQQRGFTIIRLAARLRCGGCRSGYIRVWRW